MTGIRLISVNAEPTFDIIGVSTLLLLELSVTNLGGVSAFGADRYISLASLSFFPHEHPVPVFISSHLPPSRLQCSLWPLAFVLLSVSFYFFLRSGPPLHLSLLACFSTLSPSLCSLPGGVH